MDDKDLTAFSLGLMMFQSSWDTTEIHYPTLWVINKNNYAVNFLYA